MFGHLDISESTVSTNSNQNETQTWKSEYCGQVAGQERVHVPYFPNQYRAGFFRAITSRFSETSQWHRSSECSISNAPNFSSNVSSSAYFPSSSLSNLLHFFGCLTLITQLLLGYPASKQGLSTFHGTTPRGCRIKSDSPFRFFVIVEFGDEAVLTDGV